MTRTWAAYSADMEDGTTPPLNTRSTAALLCWVVPERSDSSRGAMRMIGARIAAAIHPTFFLLRSSVRAASAALTATAVIAILRHVLSVRFFRLFAAGAGKVFGGEYTGNCLLCLICLNEIPPGIISAQSPHSKEIGPRSILYRQRSCQQVRVLVVESPDLPSFHRGTEKARGLPW